MSRACSPRPTDSSKRAGGRHLNLFGVHGLSHSPLSAIEAPSSHGQSAGKGGACAVTLLWTRRGDPQ